MECDKYLEMISLYIDGELNKQEQEELSKHMEVCENCKSEYENIKEVVNMLNKTEYLPLPKGYHEKLMEKIEKEKVESVKFTQRLNRKISMNKKYISIAAGFVVLAVVGIGGSGITKNMSGGGAASSETAPSAQNFKKSAMPMESTEYSVQENSSYDTAAAEEMGISPTAVDDNASTEKMSENNSAYDVNISERKNIKTSYISITVENFDTATEMIKNNAEASNGYVQNFNSYIYYEDRDSGISLKSGSMTIRVDKNSYSSIKDAVKSIGEVLTEDEYVEDVTSQYIDTAGKLEAKMAEESRLLELISQADNVQDIIAIEERLSDVRGYIESYQSIINNWDKLVELSTINIDIREEMPSRVGKISSNFSSQVKEGFIQSINYVVEWFQNTVIWFATASVPLLLIAAALLAATKIISAIIRKKKRTDSK
ncbi:MAG: DUF4349 domain-containing protein [Firmicutes bacterium]|nr:DUF4349 domain-containing protein [Bacillota bacterium]